MRAHILLFEVEAMNRKEWTIVVFVGSLFCLLAFFMGTRVDAPKDLITPAVSGIMLFLGIFLGSKYSATAMRKEFDGMLEDSETFAAIKRVLTDEALMVRGRTLLDAAIKFFEDGSALVSSPEAKNFFANATKLLQQLGEEPSRGEILKIPQKPKS